MDEKTILVNGIKMMNIEKMKADSDRTREVILSCENLEQLKVAVRMFNQLNILHVIPEKELNKLENLIGLMRIRCASDDITEDIYSEFRGEAMKAGPPLSQINFVKEEEFIGGEADNMTPEDLSRKHDVDVKDIKKEVSIGTKIEMEHTDSEEEAKEIAMDHIAEYPDYYTNDNFGIVAIEKARGEGRKTIRISKSDMDKLHKDGKLDVGAISLSYQEDMDEATGASSSGAYVGALGRPITRTFKKSEIPVSVNGMNFPIGKMYSFTEDKEVLEEEELDEAVDYAGAVGAYETPKFWAKGKDNWRGRTQKTYPGGKFVNIKKKCRKFPYCNQGSGGPGGPPITLTDKSEMEIDGVFGEGRILKTVKRVNLKIKK